MGTLRKFWDEHFGPDGEPIGPDDLAALSNDTLDVVSNQIAGQPLPSGLTRHDWHTEDDPDSFLHGREWCLNCKLLRRDQDKQTPPWDEHCLPAPSSVGENEYG